MGVRGGAPEPEPGTGRACRRDGGTFTLATSYLLPLSRLIVLSPAGVLMSGRLGRLRLKGNQIPVGTTRRVIRIHPTWQPQTMDASTEEQLSLIHKVVTVMRAADIPVWLFGGWGLDARIGRITRDHGDVEFWIERHQDQRSKALLAEAGAIPILTQPPEEACEFTWDGVPFSTAYFERQPDRTITVRGRWSDWELPPESFGDDPGILDGQAVPTMSATGMLAMKQQFPSLRNGRPWREKDREDIETLRALITREAAPRTWKPRSVP